MLQCKFVVRPTTRNPLYTDDPVMPPAKKSARALPRRLFDQRFAPIPKRPHDITHDRAPAGADERHWWTVVTGPLSATWHIYPGIGHGEDEQYIQCRRPWGGNAADHPHYVY
ncbi:hypothetical protein [Hyphomicrobium sp. DY-1]|uniref:hypothetical protein n=1 Tax=Hyphomicrobium sp. DY-1 TaxID=3075650 RepID=UPI0039C4A93E